MPSQGLQISLALASALRGDPLDLSQWKLEELVEAAEAHGITALLWKLADRGQLPESLGRALQPHVQRLAAQDLFVQRDIRRVLDALAPLSVSALLVKGAALAYTIYPEPYARPRSDTDVFVRMADVDAAVEALRRCGHAPTAPIDTTSLVTHQMKFDRIDEHGVYQSIDLHWKLANPHVLADALSFDLLWKEAQPSPTLGPSARVPSRVGSTLLACMHRVAHHQHQERLIWLYDLKLLTALLTGAEWAALGKLAAARGIAGLCLGGLMRAKSWLNATLPSDVERSLAAAAPAEKSLVYTTRPVLNQDVLISDLRALTGWRPRARLLREHLVPPVARLRQRYRTKSRWLVPVLYLHRVWKVVGKWVGG